MQYSDSLKKNQDFQKVYRKGTSQANRYLVMYVLKNGHMENRLGISVSKKVGNSVVRHRITRLIRESYRLNETLFEKGLDIVVVARTGQREGLIRKSKAPFCIWVSGINAVEGSHDQKMDD